MATKRQNAILSETVTQILNAVDDAHLNCHLKNLMIGDGDASILFEGVGLHLITLGGKPQFCFTVGGLPQGNYQTMHQTGEVIQTLLGHLGIAPFDAICNGVASIVNALGFEVAGDGGGEMGEGGEYVEFAFANPQGETVAVVTIESVTSPQEQTGDAPTPARETPPESLTFEVYDPFAVAVGWGCDWARLPRGKRLSNEDCQRVWEGMLQDNRLYVGGLTVASLDAPTAERVRVDVFAYLQK